MRAKSFSIFIAMLLSVAALFCSPLPAQAQAGVNVEPSLLLLRSEIGNDTVCASAFAVKSTGNTTMAVTSYEAVKGARTISAVVPNQGIVMCTILKFAPDANLALLDVAAANVPALRIGDIAGLRTPCPLKMVSVTPIQESAAPTAVTTIPREGQLQNIIARPTGAIARVTFMPGIQDNTTGAPFINPSTGEVVGVGLSLTAAQDVDTLRFVIPTNLLGALDPELATPDGAANIRVLDGSQAPVITPDATDEEGDDSIVIYLSIGLPVIIIIGAFVAVRKKHPKAVPFSVLPHLPETVMYAFINSKGELLNMDKDVITVGRAPDNDWVFPDKTVSNHHAKVKRIKGSNNWEVEDCHSSNGTFVRGRRIGSAETITPDSRIRFGKKMEIMLLSRARANANLPKKD